MSQLTATNEMFLPWVDSANDRRFRKLLITCLIIFGILGTVVPFLPIPEIIKKDIKNVSPRISKLIIEMKKEPPPKPIIKKEKIKKKPVKKKKKVDKKAAAYKKASNSGLVALSAELTDLRDGLDFSVFDDKPLKNTNKKAEPVFVKKVIASNTNVTTGIKVNNLAGSTGDAKLNERTTTKVTSSLDVKTTKVSTGSNRALRRDEREIEQVFQKNKGAIYSIYNRALRKDPTLEGKVIIELTINSSGTVTLCRITSSELNNPEIERKIVSRVKLFKFKPANVDDITVTFPIDFLPS